MLGVMDNKASAPVEGDNVAKYTPSLFQSPNVGENAQDGGDSFVMVREGSASVDVANDFTPMLQSLDVPDDGNERNYVLESQHKIFLSHTGAQKSFVADLCADLRRRGQDPFFDKLRTSLPIGENFPNLIFKAIEQCQVGVVVLTEEFFTRSKWPMLELVAMVEESQKPNRWIKIIPVFYGISPSRFRDRDVQFEWMRKHWKKWEEQDERRIDVEKWKSAVDFLGSINGLVMKGGMLDRDLRADIVKTICKGVSSKTTWDDSSIEGKTRLCQEILKKIYKGMQPRELNGGVRVMGLYGMGGIGKTTVCKILCNELSREYCDKVCHVELGSLGEEELYKKVLSVLSDLDVERLEELNVGVYRGYLKNCLIQNKVFLVLDNVSDESKEQVNSILKAGFVDGSVVLVTARSMVQLQHLDIKADNCFAMPELEYEEAKSLFLSYAGLMENDLDEGLLEKCVRRCCFPKSGSSWSDDDCHYHPLALKVLGGQVRDELCFDMTRQARLLIRIKAFNLSQPEEHPVFSILKSRFDSLEEEDQWLFLDVVFFLPVQGDLHNYTVSECLGMVLGKEVEDMLERLMRRSLLESFDDRDVKVHDLWREFAASEIKDGKFGGQRFLYQDVSGNVTILRRSWHGSSTTPSLVGKGYRVTDVGVELEEGFSAGLNVGLVDQQREIFRYILSRGGEALLNRDLSKSERAFPHRQQHWQLMAIARGQSISKLGVQSNSSQDLSLPIHTTYLDLLNENFDQRLKSQNRGPKNTEVGQDLDVTGNPQLEEIDQAKSIQDMCNMYIKCGKFEDFCNAEGIHGERLIEIGRGRLTAALFPRAFYHHLKTLLMSSKSSKANLPHLFQEATNLVVKDLQYAKKESQVGESQLFQFFDEVHNGDPVDVDDVFSLGGLMAICQKFPQGGKQNLEDLETNYSIKYCIVQHDLTGAYLCRRVVEHVLDDQLIENGIGVLGVEVTGKDIHVENIRDDGSYYSGTLKDFSYSFVLNNNGDSEAMEKQCATKLFGHVKGAEFLARKEYGLKCSPLLAIALTIATQKNSTLALKWNRTYGHMEIQDDLEHFTEFEKLKWQVLYTDKINQLGLDVKWGMEQVLKPYEMTNSQASGTSNLQALASVFGNGVQQKRSLGLQFSLPGGVGIGGNIEMFGSKGKELVKETHPQIMEHLRREASQFVETPDLDAKHAQVKDDLLQGRLPDAQYNYLVVWDNADNGHVSVYWAMDDGKLTWITDILLPRGKCNHKNLFKARLRGLRMKVKRDGSKLVSTDAHKPATDLISRFKKHKKLDIDSSMTQVPPGLQSNDEWEHLIGRQAKYSGNKFLWEATFMRAIIASRTSYLSGAMLDTYVLKNKFGEIGHCSRNKLNETGQCNYASQLIHDIDRVAAWGQFSKAPTSLVQGTNLIKWGGLIDENDLC